MVFVLECRVLSAIFSGKMEGMGMKKVRLKLVLLEPHGGKCCTCQKVQVCIVSLRGYGMIRGLSRFITTYDG